MKEQKKGCVYFFRHIGLSPIKIGYSENESPYKRFEQFKTYAPFGAELIGFIRTFEAKKLETDLHKKYARDRIKGEWFEITKEEAEKCIQFYSNIEDIEEMNKFQIEWSKRIYDKETIFENINHTEKLFFEFYSLEQRENFQKTITTQTEISEFLNIEKSLVKKILNTLMIYQRVYRIKDSVKRGVLLYKKT